MSAVEQPKSHKLYFRQQSDTQSTCPHCGEIIRVSTATCLELAEEVHSEFCPALPKKASRRA